MGTFSSVDFDFSATTLHEGWELFLKGGGKLCGIGYGYKLRGKVTAGPHWSGRWIGTQGMGNHGEFVLIPLSNEARKLVRSHTVTVWENQYGISHSQALAIYGHRGPYKHELIEKICGAVLDTACHQAFRNFPGVGPGLHNKWAKRWNEVVASHLANSWPRNEALIATVRAVIK